MVNERRGQSEVLAIVMLIGLVIIGASSVFIVGSSAISSIQDYSQEEHDVNEIQSISHEVDTVVQSADSESSSTESSTSVDLQGGYVASDTRGPEVTIEVDDEIEYEEQIGTLERDGFVYEGGLAIHEEDERIIEEPRFNLRDQSTLLHFQEIAPDSSNFDGTFRHTETDSIDEPEDYLRVEVESEYYELWAESFEGAAGYVNAYDENTTAVLEYDLDDGPPPTAPLELGLAGETDLNPNDLPRLEFKSYDGVEYNTSNANYNIRAEAHSGNNAGEWNIYGDLRSTEDISDYEDDPQIYVEGDIMSYIDFAEPTPTPELMLGADDVSFKTESDYDGDEDITGGVYYSEDSVTIDDDVAVEDDTILIIEDDLTIEAGGELRANSPIDVYVHGDLVFDDENGEPPRVVDGSGAETLSEQPNARQISFFVHDDYDEEIRAEGPSGGSGEIKPLVTGYIHATNATVNFAGQGNAEVDMEMYGAIIADDTEGQHQNEWLRIYYDEQLGERPHPFATEGGTISVQLEQIVNADLFDQDTTIDGPAEITEDKNENILIDGTLRELEEATVAGDLFVDGDVEEIDDGIVQGSLLVDGDIEELDNATIGGDVRLTGEVSDEFDDVEIGNDLIIGSDLEELDDTHIGGDLRVEGDVTDELDGVEVEGDLIVEGDLEEFDDDSVGGNLVVGGDVTDELDGVNIGGDMFVEGSVEKMDGWSTDGHLVIMDGINDEPDGVNVGQELFVGDDVDQLDGVTVEENLSIDGEVTDEIEDAELSENLLVDGDIEELDDSTIDDDIITSGELKEDDGNTYNDLHENEHLDLEPPTLYEEYIDTDERALELPNPSEEFTHEDHEFDVRVSELELE